MLLASMQERQREIAVLRAIGAGPWVLFGLIQLEAILVTLTAIGLALALVTGLFAAASDVLAAHYGVFISSNVLSPTQFLQLAAALAVTILVALIPSINAYRKALHVSLSGR